MSAAGTSLSVAASPEPALRNPPPARVFARLGFGTVAATVGGLLLWSALAPIKGAVVAGGRVVVESDRKTVQHLEGGTVAEILVREGEEVEAGELLLRLDATADRANAGLIDAQLTELYARRARLEAERDGGATLARPRGAPEVLAGAAFAEKLAGQTDLFAARARTRMTQIALLEERIQQQRERIVGIDAQATSLAEQRVLIEEDLAGVRELNEAGYAPLTRLRALERESRRLAGQRGAYIASRAEAESIISEARLEIERLTVAGREEAIAELRDVEVSIAELEERRVAAVDRLARTEIRAPAAGRVLALSARTEGGVVAPGAAILEIVPEGDRLQVAAQVSPADVDAVEAGQAARLRFTGLGGRTTPEVDGRVARVAADSLIDETTGVAYFTVRIDLPDDATLAAALAPHSLTPGMPAEAFIATGAQPALAWLVRPLRDSMARSLREE